MTEIIKVGFEHIPQVAPLLDAYRVFYGQPSDLAAATEFLEERVSKEESIIFLALENGTAIGFTQLYTSYSTVWLKPVFILNDLFVQENCREKGVGAALLEESKKLCRTMRYKAIALETAIDNPAQKLYEKLGWEKDTACFHYFWTCN